MYEMRDNDVSVFFFAVCNKHMMMVAVWNAEEKKRKEEV